ncbi:nitrogen fixation protein NifX [Thermocrinis albus DSM 14484]|uniref:Nitrogen fixation protein NifX n=1 Tax=Thermocrinis albus (strain DSM 14484 / JCM 11386 / HI 11/12) TaxID=638303 RepID=D3SPH9_THEAH|nr:nitrogen fixation protein NifX [Thermocrinis albus]ADC89066.1 nitrogen fixation protein NifX [Thermocrinis albus DSM 14484]
MLRVAFATKSLDKVDDHFGHARVFAIYDVGPTGYSFVEYRYFEDIPDEEYDKINSKVEKLMDCSIVYVIAIGATAAARIVKHKIHPVKVNEPTPIEDIVNKLVETLNSNPPPWLKKALMDSKEKLMEG